MPATALSVRSSATPELSAAPTTSNRPPYTAVPTRRPHCAAAAAVTRPASCAEPIVGAVFLRLFDAEGRHQRRIVSAAVLVKQVAAGDVGHLAAASPVRRKRR